MANSEPVFKVSLKQVFQGTKVFSIYSTFICCQALYIHCIWLNNLNTVKRMRHNDNISFTKSHIITRSKIGTCFIFSRHHTNTEFWPKEERETSRRKKATRKCTVGDGAQFDLRTEVSVSWIMVCVGLEHFRRLGSGDETLCMVCQ